jgi:hypothetical protein
MPFLGATFKERIPAMLKVGAVIGLFAGMAIMSKIK